MLLFAISVNSSCNWRCESVSLGAPPNHLCWVYFARWNTAMDVESTWTCDSFGCEVQHQSSYFFVFSSGSCSSRFNTLGFYISFLPVWPMFHQFLVTVQCTSIWKPHLPANIIIVWALQYIERLAFSLSSYAFLPVFFISKSMLMLEIVWQKKHLRHFLSGHSERGLINNALPNSCHFLSVPLALNQDWIKLFGALG